MELAGDIVYKVTKNNIHIQDSYKVTSKSKMIEVLYIIQHNHPDCNSFKRSYNSLISEWRTHNRLYRLGFKRSRTADVDLDAYPKWYMQLLYWIWGI